MNGVDAHCSRLIGWGKQHLFANVEHKNSIDAA